MRASTMINNSNMCTFYPRINSNHLSFFLFGKVSDHSHHELERRAQNRMDWISIQGKEKISTAHIQRVYGIIIHPAFKFSYVYIHQCSNFRCCFAMRDNSIISPIVQQQKRNRKSFLSPISNLFWKLSNNTSDASKCARTLFNKSSTQL